MDDTPENILMCRQAQPIQELFRTNQDYCRFNAGHFIVWGYKDDPDQHIYTTTLGGDIEYDREANCLFRPGVGRGSHLPENYQKLDYDWAWIPRLDQLLDMVSGMRNSKISRLYFFCFGFSEFKNAYEISPLFTFKSPEQIALALVMYDNHNKVWNGNKWLKFIK